MTDYLAVDPDRLNRANKGVTDLSETVLNAKSALDAALAALGECWGHGDEIAEQFIESYVQTAKDVSASMQDLADGLTNTADDLHNVAKNYAKAEQQAGDVAGQVQ